MFNLSVLQEAQRPWVKHNFGDRPGWMPLLGIFEELGELREAEENNDHDEIIDALADMIIFCSDYCEAQDWNAQELWDSNIESESFWASNEIESALGKLSHAHLKKAQNIRVGENHNENGKEAMSRVFAWLKDEAYDYNISDILHEVEQVWNKVKQRDWKKDPTKANV